MSLNWKEIDLILEELDLENSHIQKIRQPDFKTLILDLYKPGNRFPLLISMKQGKVRLHRLTGKIDNKIPLQRFAQLLRSRINGGKITKAYQIGRERIVLIKIQRAETETGLYLRLWGGNPNIIAVDENGIILDAFFRRPGKGEVSGKKYSVESQINPLRDKSASGKEYTVRNNENNESFSSFIEKEYRDKEQHEEFNELSARIGRYLDSRLSQAESSIDALEKKISDSDNYELYRQQAELIKAHIYEISGETDRITVDNFFNQNEKIVIELDPRLSPSENAEKLFKKYKKEKAGLENLKQELENIKSIKRKLEADKHLLFNPEDDIDSALKNLREYEKNIKSGTVEKAKENIPGLQFLSGGFTILVGRTATENDTLLRKFIKGNDYWLHTRDFPGGYVFIKYKRGKSVPLETLLDAGNLALFFSKGRKNGNGELYYTQAKYLRRARNGKKGLVLPTQEKNLSIRLDQNRINRLLNRGEESER